MNMNEEYERITSGRAEGDIETALHYYWDTASDEEELAHADDVIRQYVAMKQELETARNLLEKTSDHLDVIDPNCQLLEDVDAFLATPLDMENK